MGQSGDRREAKKRRIPRSDPDRAIYKRLLQRDPDGIAQLARKYSGLLASIIADYLKGDWEEDIDEVLSDVLLRVWQDVEEYDPQRARFKTWLVMKARYCALDHQRKLARGTQRIRSLPPLEISLSHDDVSLWLDLSQALMQLKPLNRYIVYACDYLGRDRQEVAEELGMKVKTLNTRLFRVRRRLRRSLRAWRPQEQRDE